MQNKHDPAKQLKKAGAAGQESKVFILLEENEQVEPIDTLPLNQEAVKRKNQRARGLSTLCFSYKNKEQEGKMRKKDKEFFEYMEKNFKTPPEIAELFYYFDRRVVRYRLIIVVLLMIIALLIIFKP